MSLDGFIARPNETDDNALGDGGDRLHDWAFPDADPDQRGFHIGRLAGANGEISEEMMKQSSPAGGISSRRAAGDDTTTACRSGSTAALSPAST
jgi:hypothetical protein